MKTYIRRGRIDREKGDVTFFTELEIDMDGNIIITIRRYTSRTFVAIKNEYRHFTKIVFKDYHNSFFLLNVLRSMVRKYKLSFSAEERGKIISEYKKLEEMPIIDRKELVF